MKTLYVIGNGPSLNDIDITQLKDKTTVSFNRAYIAYEDWGFYPTYYQIIDPTVFEDNKEDIKNLLTTPINKFIFGNSEYFKSEVSSFNTNEKEIEYSRIVGDVAAASVLHFFNRFERFILLGCDNRYSERQEDMKYKKVTTSLKKMAFLSEGDDCNHFRPDYFGKGKLYGHPNQPNHYKAFQMIPDKKRIISCSKNSNLNTLFEYKDFNNL